ncbi:protein PRR14L [Pimephales promelas]|nr:protein PRR14L [Pimephales promelas]
MTSIGVEAEMEEQYSEDESNKMVSPCVISGTRPNLSTDKPLNSTSAMHVSSQADVLPDTVVVLHRLSDKDTSFGNKESYTRVATRKSPRKIHLSWMAEPTSKPLDLGMKESQSGNVMERTHHSAKGSDPPMSTTVGEVKQRSREVPRSKKDSQAWKKCDAKKGRCVRNKKLKDNGVTLEINQEDETYIEVRKKKEVSKMHNHLDLDLPICSSKTADVEMRNSVETSEEMGQDKRMRSRLRKNRRNIRPPKHKFEDYRETSMVDPAGPSKPSKIPLVHRQQSITVSEEQRRNKGAFVTGFSRSGAFRKKTKQTRKECKTTKKKDVSVPKRKGSKDEAEAVPVVSLSGSGSNRLLRSYSCPEIPSLLSSDCHLPRSHTHDTSTTSPSRKSSPTQLPIHYHSPSKRTRRHTVCSVEIEREIAPLCLRKEVYPASRGGPLCPSSPYSPSTSLSALASCFLSSPLAFLSKSSSQGRGHASEASTGSISAASSFVTSSSSPSFSSPFSTHNSCHALTGLSSVVTPSPETPSASVSSLCSSLEGDHGVLQMECEEARNEEEGSNFDLKLSAAISEEKALSDSEIKTDIKDGQGGKVSSIRIRKKIPKPQNNLTPMGLPKVIRIKKKDFSLEEIYTNKNFSKPPDGRLETIFEVPLNRRDGSQAVVGQKKVKRFFEFPELGVTRKPKKPLVGVMAGGGAQRKAGGNSGIARTRRGVGGSSKVQDGLTLQELESLLCSKLEELDTWMALQQIAG